jgi:capsid protein
MLPDDMIRERGLDPDTYWEEYAKQIKRWDELGIVLDVDLRQRTQAGNAHTVGTAGAKSFPSQPQKSRSFGVRVDATRIDPVLP